MSAVKIGIIGGSGSMGRWFKRFFCDAGHTVFISGRKTELTYTDLAVKSDVVILSVPLDAAMRISGEIGSILSQDQLLMDVCSLKESILKKMLRSTSAQVVGTHPLFGPFTDSIRKQNIIICPGRGTGWLSWLENEFQAKGAVVTRMDEAAHDKNMAVVQGLTHFITVCLGRTLQKLNIAPFEAITYSTPIFRVKLDLIGRLFAQDLNLFQNLIEKNSYVKEVLETFLSAMDEGKEYFLSDQKQNASEYLNEIQVFIGKFCKEGLKESNRFLNVLYTDPSTEKEGRISCKK